MPDFAKHLQEGFEAAKKADAAREEISQVLQLLQDEILKTSDGKLLIELKLFDEQLSPFDMISRGAFSPVPKYLALAVSNPKAAQQTFRVLARWLQGQAGYPCSLKYNKQEVQCENRIGLERALANLLRDPSIGEITYSVLNQN